MEEYIIEFINRLIKMSKSEQIVWKKVDSTEYKTTNNIGEFRMEYFSRDEESDAYYEIELDNNDSVSVFSFNIEENDKFYKIIDELFNSVDSIYLKRTVDNFIEGYNEENEDDDV